MKMLATYTIWFGIYAFIGWIYESGLRSIRYGKLYNSGFLFGPYIPIYGFGAIIDIYLCGSLNNPFYVFIICAFIDTLLEYITSWGMEKLFHARWWDYSDNPFNINGRVFLGGFIAFGLFACVVVLFVHPFIAAHTTVLMSNLSLYICALVIVIVMLTDTIRTVISIKDFEKKVAMLEERVYEIKDNITERLDDRKEAFDESKEKHLERIREVLGSFNSEEKRLMNAFPHLKFENARYEIEEIRKMIRENNEKSFHNR